MKRVLAVVVALSAVAAWGQPKVGQIKSTTPRFELLENDGSQFEGARFYDQGGLATDEEPAAKPPPKRELGPIDKWRFDSCQTDAAKAPTSQGVFAGLRVCREKFGQ